MIPAEPSTADAVNESALDPASFRAAMACFPSGVTIVTTQDVAGKPYGFTASSFCSVSLEPPLILVCIAKSANSYPVFMECKQFAVSILQPHHSELAKRFASKVADKFAYGRFARTSSGLTVVDGAVAAVECSLHRQYEAGDHVIMVGLAHEVRLAAGGPAVYFNRTFGTVGLAPGALPAPADPHP